MTPERWQQVNELFLAAAELEPEQRADYLDQVCGNDQFLRSEVESLLRSDGGEWDFIERPALEVAAQLLANERQQLNPGQNFSHYQIISLIGKGGMGEVYLAADTLLNRKIALKLLPADYTRDKDRLRRFQQEAHAASALNHPNILTIHEIGNVDDQRFIATEFVDGETLRQRLNRARLSLSETIEIAIQIAGALSAAHRAGIVHRDIKPENIMLRHDGYAKVLDFGLAKLTEQQEQTAGASAADSVNISSGLVMGTVKYMSPEQARGQQVDLRSDIFSFGIVLYEMIAGRAPFAGGTTSELIAGLLKKDPPPLENTPDELQRIVSTALRKKKKERYQTIDEMLADLKLLKERAVSVISQTGVPAYSAARSTSGGLAVSAVGSVLTGIARHKTAAAFVLAIVAIVALGLSGNLGRLSSRLHKSRGIAITRIPDTDNVVGMALSPDGEYLAYAERSTVGQQSLKQSLSILRLTTNDRNEIIPPKDISYGGLTYSPDGTEIYYVNKDVLYKVPASGGEAALVLNDVSGTISFSPDGRQFAFCRGVPDTKETLLMIANVDGSGERVLATRKQPVFLGQTAWSPDATLIVCMEGVMAKNSQRGLVGFDVGTGEQKEITNQKWDELGGPVWLPDGSGLVVPGFLGGRMHIWEISYSRGEANMITSDPSYDHSDLCLTADGKNIIALESANRSALWIVPRGDSNSALPITSGEHHEYSNVSWTSDGRIVYGSLIGTSRDVWIMNSEGTRPKQLTSNMNINMQARPTPDGRYIVFSSNRANEGAYNLWRMDIDGNNPIQLTHGDGEGQPACSPDGRWVVYSSGGPNTAFFEKTLWKVPIDGGAAVPVCTTPSSGAAVSPDGTLIACWYSPNPATPRKMQIALLPFDGGPPVKILEAGTPSTHHVRWSPDGQSISYISTRPFVGNIWNQPVSGGPPHQLTHFTAELINDFDWTPDWQLICSRSHRVQDVIMIANFR